ncbi:MAG TPA: vWA domain-containing protein [Gaiellaceae bacterium]|nr:vWA domain-containing protein [Gaiellaceae bacterium]
MRALPTGDGSLLRRPARRTSIVAAVLAAALLAAAAGVATASRGLETREAGMLAPGESTIVVLDLSLSIPPVVYRRMRFVIDELSRENGSVGLIVFSDSAYELLPPGTPARELRPLLRFLTRRPPPPDAFDDRPYYLPDPWSDAFRSGTKISAALDLAREVVQRDRVRASVLLISDLHSGEPDQATLVTALQRLSGAGVRLRVVPLFALDFNRRIFADIVGEEAFADWRALVARRRGDAAEAVETAAASPLPLVVAAALLLALLAANEVWCRRLALPRRAA